MKFGITDLHIICLSICDFHEHWHTEGHTFVTGLNEITFTHVLRNHMLSRMLGMPLYDVMDCAIYSLANVG
jgi:hypothetical protein